jgi:hypothetical protein
MTAGSTRASVPQDGHDMTKGQRMERPATRTRLSNAEDGARDAMSGVPPLRGALVIAVAVVVALVVWRSCDCSASTLLPAGAARRRRSPWWLPDPRRSGAPPVETTRRQVRAHLTEPRPRSLTARGHDPRVTAAVSTGQCNTSPVRVDDPPSDGGGGRWSGT